jgi:hypothetical protein
MSRVRPTATGPRPTETAEPEPEPFSPRSARSRKLSLPKLIQKIADEAASNTAWAPALRAAPAAISVMAICLVASVSDQAEVIEVSGETKLENGKVITLP